LVIVIESTDLSAYPNIIVRSITLFSPIINISKINTNYRDDV